MDLVPYLIPCTKKLRLIDLSGRARRIKLLVKKRKDYIFIILD